MTVLAAHGLAVSPPRGWDARIWTPVSSTVVAPPAMHLAGASIPMGGTPNAILHIANFPLPVVRGDYGSGAVEEMGVRSVFAAVVEFDREAASTPMFAASGVPRIRGDRFDRNAMQRVLPRRSGAQWFFHEGGRAWCLYAVVGSHALRRTLASELDAVIRTIRIGR